MKGMGFFSMKIFKLQSLLLGGGVGVRCVLTIHATQTHELKRHDAEDEIRYYLKEYTYLPYSNYLLYELLIKRNSAEATYVVVGQGWGPPHWCTIRYTYLPAKHRKLIELAENVKTVSDFKKLLKEAKELAKQWHILYRGSTYCPHFD